jgi:hypothetical protein
VSADQRSPEIVAGSALRERGRDIWMALLILGILAAIAFPAFKRTAADARARATTRATADSVTGSPQATPNSGRR